MNKHDVQKATELLRDKADFNKLVVFVGAGVSRNVPGMPSWNDLVKEMARSIGYSKCSTCRHKPTCTGKCLLIGDFTSDDYLKILHHDNRQNQRG